MAERFDLLGDPVPDNHGGPGRPEHIPTRENRLKVIRLMGLGWRGPRIAKALGVTPPTLRKHYFSELGLKAGARDRLEAWRLDRLCDKVAEGSVPAIKELGRVMERVEAREAEERMTRPARPASRLGKKAAATEAARTAGEGSEWGGDLLVPTQH